MKLPSQSLIINSENKLKVIYTYSIAVKYIGNKSCRYSLVHTYC